MAHYHFKLNLSNIKCIYFFPNRFLSWFFSSWYFFHIFPLFPSEQIWLLLLFLFSPSHSLSGKVTHHASVSSYLSPLPSTCTPPLGISLAHLVPLLDSGPPSPPRGRSKACAWCSCCFQDWWDSCRPGATQWAGIDSEGPCRSRRLWWSGVRRQPGQRSPQGQLWLLPNGIQEDPNLTDSNTCVEATRKRF